jgi:hypothetical protein
MQMLQDEQCRCGRQGTITAGQFNRSGALDEIVHATVGNLVRVIIDILQGHVNFCLILLLLVALWNGH